MTRALFVCIQNAGRSQMAQAFAAQAGLEARSAGSAPAREVHPEVADAMQELGIDIRGRVPHKLTQEDVEWADIVVTMGCGDACPYIPGKQYVDWELPDPHGMGEDGVRTVRDEIRRRIRELVS
ncbi:MAG: protein tyrosine phosphatase [Thermoleophilia bacterium]|nr:protein tyrosine phosphatase [Thermoleophilia bacterium]MCZ4495598.1 protein tyrosine phosphatase [Thermoleophilia bacterium]